MKKKMFLLIISLTLLFVDTCSTSAAEKKYTNGDILKSLHMQHQEASNEILFDEDTQSELHLLSQQIEKAMLLPKEDDDEVSLYLPNYAGSYIDNDTLIVCITEEDNVPLLKNEKIQYQIVKNSYNDLVKQKSMISYKYEFLYREYINSPSEEKELLSSICGVGIDERANAIVVDIANLTSQKINIFGKLFGSLEKIESIKRMKLNI